MNRELASWTALWIQVNRNSDAGVIVKNASLPI